MLIDLSTISMDMMYVVFVPYTRPDPIGVLGIIRKERSTKSYFSLLSLINNWMTKFYCSPVPHGKL